MSRQRSRLPEAMHGNKTGVKNQILQIDVCLSLKPTAECQSTLVGPMALCGAFHLCGCEFGSDVLSKGVEMF